jgi:hypothetical protein
MTDTLVYGRPRDDDREGAMDLDEMLTQSTAELEAAEADLHAAQQRVDELRTIQEGIRLAKSRYGQTVTNQQGGPRPAAGQTGLANTKTTSNPTRRRRRSAKRTQPQASQSEQCLQLLTEFNRSATNAEVREELANRGYVYDPEQIRAAFAYLLRKQKVMRVAPGEWALALPTQ